MYELRMYTRPNITAFNTQNKRRGWRKDGVMFFSNVVTVVPSLLVALEPSYTIKNLECIRDKV